MIKRGALTEATFFCIVVLSTFFLNSCGGGSGSRSEVPGLDNVAPTVVSTSPANGASNVPQNTVISVTFSEPVQQENIISGSAVIVNTVGGSGGAVVPGTWAPDSTGTIMSFTPTTSPLAAGTIYSITLTTEVKDLAGNRLASSPPWSFTTGTGFDNSPPSFSGNPWISASPTGSTSIVLSWNAATDTNTTPEQLRYQVCRSTSPGVCKTNPFPSSGAVVTDVPSGSTTLGVSGLTKSTTYYFVVRARDLVDLFDSNTFEVSATTPKGFVSLGASLNQESNKDVLRPSIAIVGNTPYVAWQENGGVPAKVYVKSYISNSWSLQATMTSNGDAQLPQIVSDRSNPAVPYITYSDCSVTSLPNGTLTRGNCQVVVKKLSGGNWNQVGTPLQIGGTPSISSAIAFDGNNIPYVIWLQQSTVAPGANLVYVAHFPLNGPDWVQDGAALNFDASKDGYGTSIAIDGGTIRAAWTECTFNNTNDCQVYVKGLNGGTWTFIQTFDHLNSLKATDPNVPRPIGVPSLTFANGILYVSWQEVGKIYTRSEVGGVFTSPIQAGAGYSASNTALGTTATSAGAQIPYLVSSDASGKLLVKRWNGSGWTTEGDTAVNNGELNMTGGQAADPSIAFQQGTPYVAWREKGSCLPTIVCGQFNSGSFQLYVKRLE